MSRLLLKPRGILLGVALLLAALPLGGAACRGSNPVATAATALPANQAETIAFALAKSYVVVAGQALAIAENPQTPPAVKASLKAAYQKSSPVVKHLRATAVHYNEVRAAVTAGTSTPDKAVAALAELNRILTEAAPMVDSLATAVAGGKS